MIRPSSINGIFFLISLFFLIHSKPIAGQPAVAMKPMDTVSFIYGQNLLEIGPDKLRLDLSALGANFFDENTSDFPIFSSDEGWIHHILNPSWHGVLVVWERETECVASGEARYMIIHAGDESLVSPGSVVHDYSGVFAVATRKGAIIQAGNGNGFYVPISSSLGLEELSDTRLTISEYDTELEEKAVEVRFSNASLKGIKVGTMNRQIGYLCE